MFTCTLGRHTLERFSPNKLESEQTVIAIREKPDYYNILPKMQYLTES